MGHGPEAKPRRGESTGPLGWGASAPRPPHTTGGKGACSVSSGTALTGMSPLWGTGTHCPIRAALESPLSPSPQPSPGERTQPGKQRENPGPAAQGPTPSSSTGHSRRRCLSPADTGCHHRLRTNLPGDSGPQETDGKRPGVTAPPRQACCPSLKLPTTPEATFPGLRPSHAGPGTNQTLARSLRE